MIALTGGLLGMLAGAVEVRLYMLGRWMTLHEAGSIHVSLAYTYTESVNVLSRRWAVRSRSDAALATDYEFVPCAARGST